MKINNTCIICGCLLLVLFSNNNGLFVVSSSLLLWPCPAGACWTIENANDKYVKNLLANLWTPPCPYCGVITEGCEWGTSVVWSSSGTPECLPCLTENILNLNRVMVNTKINSCQDANITICAKNFYPDQYAPEGMCLPCLQIGAVACDDGFYPRNCITTIDHSDISTRCSRCMVPTLQNASVFQYGQGFSYSDCSSMPNPTNLDVCAYFGTPKWGDGYCSVTCAAGFVLSAFPLSFGDMPNCIECATVCQAGYYPPSCPGGQTTIMAAAADFFGAACLSCDDILSLPVGAMWITSSSQTCAWTCIQEGYYAVFNDGFGVCVLCPSSFSVQDICEAGFKWLGCGVTSQVIIIIIIIFIILLIFIYIFYI